MPLFWKPYRSDTTDFIQAMKRDDPTLEERQRAGRARLWDRPRLLDGDSATADDRLPQPAYVYQTKR